MKVASCQSAHRVFFARRRPALSDVYFSAVQVRANRLNPKRTLAAEDHSRPAFLPAWLRPH
ncbi:hypothetical protein B0E53_01719 [Micromonospora sp. MH33]|nr:hypothetical protein B0E53_01719 [Micromonospora sp. MH33]